MFGSARSIELRESDQYKESCVVILSPAVSDFPPIDPVALAVAMVAGRRVVDRDTQRGGARPLP